MADYDPSAWAKATLRREWRKLAEEVGDAWKATPDDMLMQHATLADAVAELVRQRDVGQSRADNYAAAFRAMTAALLPFISGGSDV